MIFERDDKLVDTIKSLCKKQGKTFAEIEENCGLGERSIYKWDINIPSVDRVKKVAEYLGVTVEVLLDGEKGGKSG